MNMKRMLRDWFNQMKEFEEMKHEETIKMRHDYFKEITLLREIVSY